MSRAVFLDEGVRVADRSLRSPGPGEVRLRVSAAAITGLDLDIISGRGDFRGTPGHAFVGRVVDAQGPLAQQLVGHRVIPTGSWGCGVCDECAAQLEQRCVHRRIAGVVGADGGHAEEVVLPARNVRVVPDDLTDEAAVLLPMAAAIYSAIHRARLPEWTNFLVVGDGGTGLLAAVALARAGYTVTVRGRHGDRFDLLRRYRVNFNLVDDEHENEGMRPGRYGPTLMSYPYVVEATGSPSGWIAATELVSPGGTLLMLSSALDGVPRAIHRIQEKSVRVIGLREGPIDPILEIIAQDLFDPTVVIRRVFPFEDVLRAYTRAQASREWISLLRMHEDSTQPGA